MKPTMSLRIGETFTVETEGHEPFEAVLEQHFGWGLVHGQVELGCRRADSGEKFTYVIRYDELVDER